MIIHEGEALQQKIIQTIKHYKEEINDVSKRKNVKW